MEKPEIDPSPLHLIITLLNIVTILLQEAQAFRR
jgi:hypothetical protein